MFVYIIHEGIKVYDCLIAKLVVRYKIMSHKIIVITYIIIILYIIYIHCRRHYIFPLFSFEPDREVCSGSPTLRDFSDFFSYTHIFFGIQPTIHFIVQIFTIFSFSYFPVTSLSYPRTGDAMRIVPYGWDLCGQRPEYPTIFFFLMRR